MLPPSSTATTTAAATTATNGVITSTAANSNDDTGNIKKMRCSTANIKSISNKQRHKVDNKRKERNWQDNFTTTAEVTEVHNEFFVDSKKMGLHIPSTSANVSSFTKPATFNLQPSESMKERVRAGLKALQASKASPSSTSSSTVTNSGKKPAAQKKKTAKNQVEHSINNKAQKKIVPPSTAVAPTTTSTAKKKTNNKKRSNREDIAPGGFLSSDVTLFENPISDDWICLFCQYDIFMHGLEEAKRKNGYYRRRRERLKRLKDAELRRLGGLSESEDDQHKEHTCM
ncbi:MAG: hypothetical protein EXX96DRAFT_576832 [Benjaminiella poitrasii]|nr:MAG: hypothetical protein EXX96DRAFT_576832 [Benjaminiella poitrasii]